MTGVAPIDRGGRTRFVILALLAILVAACGGGSAARATDPAVAPTTMPQMPASPPPAGSPAPSAAAPIPSPPVSPTVAEIARLQALVTADPADADAQRDLGLALSQRVRETADPSLYAPALAALEAAVAIAPDDALAWVGVAGIQLGKHEFADALVTARKAIAASPSLVAAHAAEVDALIELGRYDEADAAAARMFGLSANLSSLARVSYLAELRGRIPAAIAAMRSAAASPGLAPENTAYVDALLGNLLTYAGDPAAAKAAYEAALALVPDHAPSLAGLGRLAVGSDDLDEAMTRFERAAAVVPLPEYVIALGDTQSAAGLDAAATRSYDLARAEIQLFQAAGVIVDTDLALFEADHGDPAAALRYATAAYEATPTVRAADALAWALHRLGRDEEARDRSREALRLGSIDPVAHYHMGAIEAALGNDAAARRHLEHALKTDPGWSATAVADARRLLAGLP